MIAVHLENGRVEVKSIPVARYPEGYARIRVLAAGICSTDLELRRGYYGFSGTPGHEFVGEVIECENKSWVGKRVVGEINLACRMCAWCVRGLERHCPNRTVLGIVKHPGAFREQITLPWQNLHEVPAKISDEQAVFIEPVAAACEILDQVKVPRGSRVAVLGDGKLGLLIAQVLAAHGAKVQLFGRHPEKMNLVKHPDITPEVLREKIPVAEWPYVVDATGSPEGLKTAVKMVQPTGIVVLKSTVHGMAPIDTAPIIVNEITLIGSRCGRFEPAIKLLASKKVKVDNLISDRFPLDQAHAAFDRAATKGVLKVLFTSPD